MSLPLGIEWMAGSSSVSLTASFFRLSRMSSVIFVSSSRSSASSFGMKREKEGLRVYFELGA